MTEPLSGALFSPDYKYRYKLWRYWLPQKPLVLFIGLNPSTANELNDDPTIRRCMGFAQKWGYGGMYMGNLYSIVSSDPKVLSSNDNLLFNGHLPGENLRNLARMSDDSSIVVCAWGSIYRPARLAIRLYKDYLKQPLFCLGVNKDGQPKHPLYLPADVKPQEWKYV